MKRKEKRKRKWLKIIWQGNKERIKERNSKVTIETKRKVKEYYLFHIIVVIFSIGNI